MDKVTVLAPPPLPKPSIELNPFSAAPPMGAGSLAASVQEVKHTTPPSAVLVSTPVAKKDWTSFWISIVGISLIACVAGIIGKMIYDNETEKAKWKSNELEHSYNCYTTKL